MRESILAVCCLIAVVLTIIICIVNFTSKTTRIVLDTAVSIVLICIIGISIAVLFSNESGSGKNDGEKNGIIREDSSRSTAKVETDKENAEVPSEKKTQKDKTEITPKPTDEPEKISAITIGVLSGNGYHDGNWQVAMQKGYFSKYLNAKIEDSCYQTIKRNGIQSAVSMGQVQLFIMNGQTFLEQKKEGIDLKAIAVINTNSSVCAAFLATQGEEAGNRVAYASKTTQATFWNDKVCNYYGWNPENYENISDNDMDSVTTLINRKADIAVADAVSIHWAEKDGKVSTKEDICQMGREDIDTNTMNLLVASKTYIDENQEVIRGLKNALSEAYRDIQSAGEQGNDSIISLLADNDETLVPVFKKIYGESVDYTNFNPEFTDEIKERLSSAGGELKLEDMIYSVN